MTYILNLTGWLAMIIAMALVIRTQRNASCEELDPEEPPPSSHSGLIAAPTW